MKRTIVIVGLVCLSATGCQTPNQANGAVAGGITGGLLGLGIGALTRNPAAGLAIGAGAGALAGNGLGAMKDRQDAKAVQAYAAANMVTINQVVSMANTGVPDDQIIRQMDTTNSYYNLTSNDVTYLNENHVSPTVIAAMQTRRAPRPVVMAPAGPPVVYQPYPYPPPPPIGVGVVVPVR